ncbi:conjugal transfer protein TraB [Acidithiobacillus sp. IBUN Pt1247-S3]|uniref:conjugal transfer protein TraB n=1 Tax=Acidithiobacillus sp. IBUN Pt1247-S3 TaxID=3166642 RepID=UPI0034E524FB
MRKTVDLAAAFTAGAVIGALAWPHLIGLAPLVLIALPFWNRRHWLAPFLSMFGYHLATTYGLIHGTDDFFPHAGLVLGVAFWTGSSLLFALPYLLYRPLFSRLAGRQTGWPRLAGAAMVTTLLLSIVSTVLPPLGLIGWTSPWIGALPGGWVALIMTGMAVGWAGSVADMPAFPALWFAGATLGLFVGLLFGVPKVPALPAHWTAIDTRYGELTGLSYVEASMQMVPKVLRDFRHGSRVVLTPESIAGPWLPGTRAIWQSVLQYTATHKGKVALIGADIPTTHGGYVDALVQMQDGEETILPDRIPVPFSMWHPWQPRDSFPMHVFGKPETAIVNGVHVGYLICYEQLLIWPALSLMGQHIRVLLAPANDWWADGTDIPASQATSARAWGAFFGVPVLRAVNQ